MIKTANKNTAILISHLAIWALSFALTAASSALRAALTFASLSNVLSPFVAEKAKANGPYSAESYISTRDWAVTIPVASAPHNIYPWHLAVTAAPPENLWQRGVSLWQISPVNSPTSRDNFAPVPGKGQSQGRSRPVPAKEEGAESAIYSSCEARERLCQEYTLPSARAPVAVGSVSCHALGLSTAAQGMGHQNWRLSPP